MWHGALTFFFFLVDAIIVLRQQLNTQLTFGQFFCNTQWCWKRQALLPLHCRLVGTLERPQLKSTAPGVSCRRAVAPLYQRTRPIVCPHFMRLGWFRVSVMLGMRAHAWIQKRSASFWNAIPSKLCCVCNAGQNCAFRVLFSFFLTLHQLPSEKKSKQKELRNIFAHCHAH